MVAEKRRPRSEVTAGFRWRSDQFPLDFIVSGFAGAVAIESVFMVSVFIASDFMASDFIASAGAGAVVDIVSAGFIVSADFMVSVFIASDFMALSVEAPEQAARVAPATRAVMSEAICDFMGLSL
jgi:hypothetical protein